MKKALGETQTLRDGCSKAEQKKNRTAADPFLGAFLQMLGEFSVHCRKT